jgi:hypothetical protein
MCSAATYECYLIYENYEIGVDSVSAVMTFAAYVPISQSKVYISYILNHYNLKRKL